MNRMARRMAGLLAVLGVAWTCAASELPENDERLRRLREEIHRLRDDLGRIEGTTRSLLGDMDRLDIESRLREAELRDVGLRAERAEEALGRSEGVLREIEAAQRTRHQYLYFRLREIYKQGPAGALRLAVGGDDLAGVLRRTGYLAYLSRKDARLLRAFRVDQERLSREREQLERERERLVLLRKEGEDAAARLQAALRERQRMIEGLEKDDRRRREALGELESAADTLGNLVSGFESESAVLDLDVHKFRGLLPWPADGTVSARFGPRIHPRFKTKIPHPGVDIDAPLGTPIRSVFDGRVVFAARLHGYGLTAIVDHRGGLLSVYAHASLLVVEAGDEVLRGQELGRVGDSGSLRGAFLYFEMRESGRPVDPETWLIRR